MLGFSVKKHGLIVLLVFVAIQAILWGTLSFSGIRSVTLLKQFGYGFILVSTVGFAFFLYKVIRFLSYGDSFSIKKLLRWQNVWPGILILLCFVYIRVHEPRAYKVVMDEPSLISTSLSMHLNREVAVVSRSNFLENTFIPLSNYVDKRPILFPFLVSVLHDLTGYRSENAFWLNFGLTFVFLIGCYWLGYIFGKRWLGVAFVLLMTGLPILIRTANGAGFELLNLVFVLLAILLSIGYVKYRNNIFLNALVFCGILLCQVRYENPIYVIAIACVILWVWLKDRRIQLTLPVALSPFLLIPYLWVHRLFSLNPFFWECQNADLNQPFSLKFFEKNLGSLTQFLFENTIDAGNSLLLSIFGLIALLLLLVYGLRRLFSMDGKSFVLWVFGLAITSYSILLLFYYLSLNDMIARRLSLPLHLAFAFALVWLVAQIKPLKVKQAFCILAACYLLFFSHRRVAARQYSSTYTPGRAVDEAMKYAKEISPDTLWIADHHIAFINEKKAAISIQRAMDRKPELKSYLDSPFGREVLIYEALRYDAEKGSWRHHEKMGASLDKDFKRELVFEKYFGVGSKIQIFKLLDIEVKGKVDWSKVNDKNLISVWTEIIP